MNNEKIIMGLKSIADGFMTVAEGLEEMSATTAISEAADLCPEPVDIKRSSKTDNKSVSKKTVEESPDVSSNSEYTEEELSNMSYNDIKKLAKELGISAVGNRKELVKKILSADAPDDSEEVEDTEATEEKKEVKSKSKTVPKSFKKSKVEEPEPDEPDEDEEDEEEDTDSTEARVREATEDMSDDDLRELLEDVGVSTKGKRQSLISKLVKAVDDGLIDIDGEDDDNESGEDEESTETEADVTEGMTKARKKAYEELCDETTEAFEGDEITREDLIEFINSFEGTDEKFKKVSDEALLTKYLTLSAMLIDDEGNIVEEGAYTINDEPYCCGHPLHYDEDSEKFVCECCGSEYEAEE